MGLGEHYFLCNMYQEDTVPALLLLLCNSTQEDIIGHCLQDVMHLLHRSSLPYNRHGVQCLMCSHNTCQVCTEGIVQSCLEVSSYCMCQPDKAAERTNSRDNNDP